jgi:hypothetical protein
MKIRLLYVTSRPRMEEYKQMVRRDFNPDTIRVMKDRIEAASQLFSVTIMPYDVVNESIRGNKFDKIFVDRDCADDQMEEVLVATINNLRISYL